ncbi:MAG: hypothetical protein R8G33_02610 [Gammaproteobacteria bacterium]|nr:hypothetical protein [Gammaproteobacteria bacterium]
MKINECPQYESCNAPICPLDENCLNSTHLEGEAVCLYLREYSKLATRDDLRGVISKEHYQVIDNAYPNVSERYNYIKKALARSANNPSKLKLDSKRSVN